ncbi:phage terminase large subunit [candidate division WOR-3 bacterium]|nr:phage terminase large subunit [candidate division WOR-3 bacterium]
MKLSNDEIDIIRERAKVVLCRRSFWEYCLYMDYNFFTRRGKILKPIAEAYQMISEGKLKHLGVCLPPRTGKSYLTSLWCSWELGNKPTGCIMRNSCSATLADDFSYDIRGWIAGSEKYKQIFSDMILSKDKHRIDNWAVTTADKNSYFCAGVGGTILGKGCNLAAIIDDSIKNVDEALSEPVLEKKWKWYTSTHKSRLESGCPEIFINTRWSRRDIFGRLDERGFFKKENGGLKIVIPALDEKGQSFCPDVKTTKELIDIKNMTDEMIWQAEWQQNPIEAEGILLPIEQLKRFSIDELFANKDTRVIKAPDGIRGRVDTADEGTDYFCSVIAFIYGDKVYIVDVIFTQEGTEITEPKLAQQLIDYHVEVTTVESNFGGKSFARGVKKILKDKGNQCLVKTKVTTRNKETRILMKAAFIKEYFVFRNDYEPGSEYDRFMQSLTSYLKAGTNLHDDANDATTGLAEDIARPTISFLK